MWGIQGCECGEFRLTQDPGEPGRWPVAVENEAGMRMMSNEGLEERLRTWK